MASASTSTAPFSAATTALAGTKAPTRTWRLGVRRRPAKALMAAGLLLHCLHLTMLRQHFHPPLERRAADSWAASKMLASPRSTEEALLRWPPGTATAH